MLLCPFCILSLITLYMCAQLKIFDAFYYLEQQMDSSLCRREYSVIHWDSCYSLVLHPGTSLTGSYAVVMPYSLTRLMANFISRQIGRLFVQSLFCMCGLINLVAVTSRNTQPLPPTFLGEGKFCSLSHRIGNIPTCSFGHSIGFATFQPGIDIEYFPWVGKFRMRV